MHVQLHGVRGSMPAPGRDFAGVGGSTSCVAVSHDGEQPALVLDAGTGLRNFSKSLAGAAFSGTIVLGHLHWDHVMGLPFFPAGDRPDARVRLLVPEQGDDPAALLGRMMSPPLFPIGIGDLRGDWRVESYDAGTFQAEGFEVLALEIPHKGGRTMGLRVSDGATSIAYLSDHAPHEFGMGECGSGALHPAALELAHDVDLLIHDAQYTAEELPVRFTWGHCRADYAADLAERAGARSVLLFHHDPGRSDAQVAALREWVAEGRRVPVDVAVEGTTIHLEHARDAQPSRFEGERA